MVSIDLNCDMGESTHLWQYSIEKDRALLPFLSSVNLACGFHAGDAHTMHELVKAALTAGVAIGAHPSFEDKNNFGRSNSSLPPGKVYDIVLYQLGALDAFLRVHNSKLHHVKPHGALYNMAAKDEVLASAITKAVYDFDKQLVFYGLSGSMLIAAAHATGLKTASEVFADRTYQDDGSLTPRSQPNAMIEDEAKSVAQVLQMLSRRTVTSVNEREVPIAAETLCIHGDGTNALAFAKAIHNELKANLFDIRSL